ncbi:MAG: tetratricopeptide repeat protein [Thermonemataceae bacterium]
MDYSNKVSQAYIQKLLNIQKLNLEKPLSEEEMKEVAFGLGMSEEEWQAVQASFQSHLDKGEGYLRYENWEDAIVELEQAVIINPHHVGAMNLLAQGYLVRWQKEGNVEDALKAHYLSRRCLDIDAKHDASLRMITLLRSFPDFNKALDEKENPAIERPNKVVNNQTMPYIIGGALALLIIVWIASSSLFERNKGDSARESISLYETEKTDEQRSEETYEFNMPDTELTSAEDYLQAGLRRAEAGDDGGALEAFNQAIKLNGNLSAAYFNRGNLQFKLNYYQAAIADFEKTINLDANNEAAYYNMGLAKYAIEDFEGAIEDYTRAIQLDANNAEAYLNRGNAYYQNDALEQACDDWTMAMDLGSSQAFQNSQQLCN